jgi:hypothetical protein
MQAAEDRSTPDLASIGRLNLSRLRERNFSSVNSDLQL